MRRKFLGMMALAGLSSGLQLEARAGAQAGAEAPVRHFVLENTQIIPIRSRYTGRQHELVVVLPASWGKDPHKTYPVLYYLDAYWDTPQLVSTYGNLIYDNFTPEFIMVGLSYPKGADYDRERRIDYTFTASGKDSGGGGAFLDFITKEAAPLVESRFGGSKANRVISGNSLGGLFSLTAAYQAPGFFAGHVAVSPAASWDDGALARLDEAYARTHRSLPARMFISYGSQEYPGFREPIAAFQRQLAARNYEGLALQNYVMQGLDHTTVKGEAYVRGLIWAWAPIKPPGPSGLTRALTGAGA
jgi:predicted alpha/beta superfamily hydrolase